MPLTPFHWSVLVFALAAPALVYLPAIAISSVIIDIEPFSVLFLGVTGPVHGFWHTYLAAGIAGLAVGLFLLPFRKRIDSWMRALHMSQSNLSDRTVVATGIFGAWTHVFLDSFLYTDIQPFAPFSPANPLLGMLSPATVYGLSALGLLAALLLFTLHLFKPTKD